MKKRNMSWLVFIGLGIIGFIIYQGTRTSHTSLAISDQLVNRLLSWLLDDPTLSSKEYYKWYPQFNYYIRKLAHFTEYSILGGLIASYFITRKSKVDTWVYALLPTVMIAILDEQLQKYVGRSSLVSDVVLDSLGGITGITLVITIYAIVTWIQRFRQKQGNPQLTEAGQHLI